MAGFKHSLLALTSVAALAVTLPPPVMESEADRWTLYDVSNTSIASYFLTDVYMDSRSRMWFAGFDGGVSVLDNEALTTYIASNSEINERVNRILEIERDVLWFGTENGIVKLDHDKWSKLDAKDVPLPHQSVTALFKAADGGLWVGTWGGGIAVRQEDGTWRTFNASLNQLAGDHIWTITQDAQGRMWAGTRTGASVFENNAWRTYKQTPGELVGNSVRTITHDAQGNVWFGTAGLGASRLSPSGVWTSFTAQEGLPSNFVTAIKEDRNGTLWFGTETGLASYNGVIWTPYRAIRLQLAHNKIQDIEMDSDGRLWFATFGGGASRWDGAAWMTIDPMSKGFITDSVTALLEDKRGNVWVGTTWGLHRFDGRAWTTYTELNSGLIYHYITGLAEDSQGRVWVGTLNGLSAYDHGTWLRFSRFSGTTAFERIPSETIYTVYSDSKGRIWLGTGLGAAVWENEAWRLYTLSDGLSTNLISIVREDSLGRIWLTHWQGINILDNGRWNALRTINADFNTDLVWAALEDNEGRMWFGTLGDGIAVYDGRTWEKHTRQSSGLSNDFVRDIQQDSLGRIWAATDGGLNVLSGNKLWMAYTSQSTPLPDNQLNALLVDSKGQVWVGTNSGGLAVYRPGASANPLIEQAQRNRKPAGAAGIGTVTVDYRALPVNQ